MEKQLNWKYRAIHFLMACMMGAAIAYASVFLLHKGFTSTTIGTMISISSILSIVMQTSLANLTDTNKKIRIQEVLNGTNMVIVVAAILLIIVPNKLLVALLTMIVFTMVKTHVPFVNSLAFVFEKEGIQVKFGIGRAFGSLAYALSTALVGQAVEATSPNILPLFYIFFTALYIWVVKTYELKPNHEITKRITAAIRAEGSDKTVDKPAESLTYPEFFKRYPKLVYLAIGTVFLLFSQTFVNTFFIQIISPIGGNHAALGTAIFIAGAVEFPMIMSLDHLTKKISVAKLMKISTIFFLVKNILLFMAPNMTWVYMSQFLSFGANALASPTFVQYINEIVDAKDLVKGQSLATIGIALSGVFASFLGGIMIDTLGVKMALFIGIITTILGGLAVIAFANEVEAKPKRQGHMTADVLH